MIPRHERFAELDAMILAGWEDCPGTEIPPDWRTRKPPEPEPELYAQSRTYDRAKSVDMDPLAAAALSNEHQRYHAAFGDHLTRGGRPKGKKNHQKLCLEERAFRLRAKIQRQARAKLKAKPNTNERHVEYMVETGREAQA